MITTAKWGSLGRFEGPLYSDNVVVVRLSSLSGRDRVSEGGGSGVVVTVDAESPGRTSETIGLKMCEIWMREQAQRCRCKEQLTAYYDLTLCHDLQIKRWITNVNKSFTAEFGHRGRGRI